MPLAVRSLPCCVSWSTFTASPPSTPAATFLIRVPPVFVTVLYVSPVSVTVLCVLLSYITASAVAPETAPFSCATFTASLSVVPAATPVIWRYTPLVASPTLTAPWVLVVAAIAADWAAEAPAGT
ncbi:hypothetical protein D9M69_531180 [compost metagenome]